MRGCTLEVYSEGLVVIESRFVYHIVDPDLRVETFFEKNGAAENGGVDFEIGEIGTSVHLYCRSRKFFCRACLLCYCFLVTKVAFKSSLDLYFHPCITEFRIEENIHTKTVVDVSRGATERIFLFSWERLGGVSRSLLSLVKL